MKNSISSHFLQHYAMTILVKLPRLPTISNEISISKEISDIVGLESPQSLHAIMNALFGEKSIGDS